MIPWRDLQGSERRPDCGAARPLAVDGPPRLNASNHLSDLIRGGMKRAILINADLDGWMEGWMDPLPPSSPTPPPSPAPPHRRWRPAGTLLHGLQSANGWLDRKVEDCQIFDLMEGRHPNTAAVFGSKQQETRGNSASLQTNVASLFPRCT